MSQKRKHTEVSGGARDVQKSAKKPRPKATSDGPHNKPKGNSRSHSSQPAPRAYTTNSLKGRIRDLKRLLEHVDSEPRHKMPAGARIERERELEACEHELAEKTAAARAVEYRKKMIGKYHQVRFFDRQKATRILKRLRRELPSVQDPSAKAALLQKMHNAEVDVNYAIYYPLLKPYSSLYPKTKRERSRSEEPADEDDAPNQRGEEQIDGPKGDAEMWKEVERALDEGTLDALRNRKSDPAPRQDDSTKVKKKKKKNDKKNPQSGSTQQAAAAQEGEEDSDGGFFE